MHQEESLKDFACDNQDDEEAENSRTTARAGHSSSGVAAAELVAGLSSEPLSSTIVSERLLQSTTTKPSSVPYACIYRPELKAFEVTRERGKGLSLGGFGFLLEEKQQNEGVREKSLNGDETSGSTTTVTTEYLFVEEVLVLHEKGLLEVISAANNQVLEPRELYNLLEPCGVPFPVYRVYAHLKSQTYRVVRHTPSRRIILKELQERKRLLSSSSGAPSDSSLKFSSLRVSLRRDAARAPPPRLLEETTADAVLQPAFDVYQPNSCFARSDPGMPDFSVAVTSFHIPTAFSQLLKLQQGDDGDAIPLKIATVSNSGTVVMFGITNAPVPNIALATATTSKES